MKSIVDVFGSSRLVVGNIIQSMPVRQSFVALGKLKTVEINLATYCRVNTCKLWVKIVDRQGREFAVKEIACQSLKDNQFHKICFDLGLMPYNSYELWLLSNGDASNSVTGKWGPSQHSHSYFFVGSTRMQGELNCRFRYEMVDSTHVETMNFVSRSNLELMRRFLKDQNRKVSIIILTKDHPDMLWECLTRIQKFVKYKPYEVVIGDTGSTDLKVDEVYRTLPPNFKVVRGLEYHFAKTNNYLAKEHATGSFLLFMNNDVYLEQDCVSDVAKYLMAYPVGSVGIRLVKVGNRIDHDGQILFSGEEVDVPNHVNVNQYADSVEGRDGFVDGNTAAFMMTRRELFEIVKGFDEEYEDIYQDCDFSLKLTKMGFQHLCVRSSRAEHLVSATRGATASSENKTDIRKYMDRWEDFSRPCRIPSYLSMVTCCNSEAIYMQMVGTLPPTDDVELVPVRNNDNYFTVTEALNLGQKLSNGKYVAFSHQDVLYSPEWLGNLRIAFAHIPIGEMGIVGFEGVGVHGDPRGWQTIRPTGSIEVQTADELCLIAVKDRLKFDEQFRFHYYGVDICLQAIDQGFRNFIVGAGLKHLSGGEQNILSNPEAFRQEARNLWNKWKGRTQKVFTTTTNFDENGIRFLICAEILNKSK